MDSSTELIRIECPGCRLVLWVDPVSRDVVKTEKPEKEKASLDDLLIQEKNKKLAADQRFISTARLRDRKKAEARKRFAEALSDVESQEDED